jgi:hypothetical protein
MSIEQLLQSVNRVLDKHTPIKNGNSKVSNGSSSEKVSLISFKSGKYAKYLVKCGFNNEI